MNEIVRTYLMSLEMHLPHCEGLALIQRVAGAHKEIPFFIQPFTGNA